MLIQPIKERYGLDHLSIKFFRIHILLQVPKRNGPPHAQRIAGLLLLQAPESGQLGERKGSTQFTLPKGRMARLCFNPMLIVGKALV